MIGLKKLEISDEQRCVPCIVRTGIVMIGKGHWNASITTLQSHHTGT